MKNNLKLNAEKKIKNQLNKILIFREANSCRVYLYQAIRVVHSLQTKLIKVAQNLSDSNLDTETKTISVDQKLFQGFKGFNSFKKSELEVRKANVRLRKVRTGDYFKYCICLL